MYNCRLPAKPTIQPIEHLRKLAERISFELLWTCNIEHLDQPKIHLNIELAQRVIQHEIGDPFQREIVLAEVRKKQMNPGDLAIIQQ